MTEYIRWESLSFFHSIFWGAGLALLYDCLRVVRGLWKHPAWLVNIQDVLYWLTAGTILSVMMYYSSNGMIRAFLLMGTGLSALLMYFILTPWLVPLAVKLLRIPLGVVWRLLSLLGRFAGKAAGFIKKGLSKVWICFKLIISTLLRREKGR